MLKVESIELKLGNKILLNPSSFSLSKGEVCGIMGPNGAGKTSLLRLLARLYPLTTSTKIQLDGEDLATINRENFSQKISFVPHLKNFSFDFTVYDFIKMGLHPIRKLLPLDRFHFRIESVLKTLSCMHLKDRFISTLSMGEQQRILLARSFIIEPKVLLLDEPTSNLDMRFQLEIWDILRNFSKQSGIVLLSVHDLLMAERFCDKIIVLDKGNIKKIGSFKKTMTEEVLKDIFGIIRYDKSGYSTWLVS